MNLYTQSIGPIAGRRPYINKLFIVWSAAPKYEAHEVQLVQNWCKFYRLFVSFIYRRVKNMQQMGWIVKLPLGNWHTWPNQLVITKK